jgi:ABC-type proline/glycine betaine transport system substrate-binding protein
VTLAALTRCGKTSRAQNIQLAINAKNAAAGLTHFADIAKFKNGLDAKIYGIEPGNDGSWL